MEEKMDWELDKKTSSEQLQQLRVLIDECWAERKEVDAEEEKIKARMEVVTRKESVIKEILEAAGLDSFPGTECVYSLKEEKGIGGPSNDEEWDRFKGWVKEKYPKAYETFFKMHMTSLKSFVSKEYAIAEKKAEEAKARGEEVPKFSIPGIPEPKPFNLLKPKAKK